MTRSQCGCGGCRGGSCSSCLRLAPSLIRSDGCLSRHAVFPWQQGHRSRWAAYLTALPIPESTVFWEPALADRFLPGPVRAATAVFVAELDQRVQAILHLLHTYPHPEFRSTTHSSLLRSLITVTLRRFDAGDEADSSPVWVLVPLADMMINHGSETSTARGRFIRRRRTASGELPEQSATFHGEFRVTATSPMAPRQQVLIDDGDALH